MSINLYILTWINCSSQITQIQGFMFYSKTPVCSKLRHNHMGTNQQFWDALMSCKLNGRYMVAVIGCFQTHMGRLAWGCGFGDWESETCFWWLDITKGTTYKATGTRLSDCIPSVICEPCPCFAAAPLMEESGWIVWRKDEEGTPSQQNVNILPHYWLEMAHEIKPLRTLL